jgi:hypothetical protein
MRLSVTKQMATGSPRRIAKLAVDIWMPCSANHPQRDALERAALTCPVHHSLHPDVDKPVVFHWRESS